MNLINLFALIFPYIPSLIIFKFFLNPNIIYMTMIQNYQNDPLLHNYLAPSYPIFIQIKYLITSLSSKKVIRNAKTDITHVDVY